MQAQATPTISAAVLRKDVYPAHQLSFPGGVVGRPDLTYASQRDASPKAPARTIAFIDQTIGDKR